MIEVRYLHCKLGGLGTCSPGNANYLASKYVNIYVVFSKYVNMKIMMAILTQILCKVHDCLGKYIAIELNTYMQTRILQVILCM